MNSAIGPSVQMSNWTTSALGGHNCTDSFQWIGISSKLHGRVATNEQMLELEFSDIPFKYMLFG